MFISLSQTLFQFILFIVCKINIENNKIVLSLNFPFSIFYSHILHLWRLLSFQYLKDTDKKIQLLWHRRKWTTFLVSILEKLSKHPHFPDYLWKCLFLCFIQQISDIAAFQLCCFLLMKGCKLFINWHAAERIFSYLCFHSNLFLPGF